MPSQLLHEIRKSAFRKWLRPKFKYPITRYYLDFLVRIFSKKDARLDKILDNVCSRAIKKGFVFKRPKIRVVSQGIGYKYRYWSQGEIVAKANILGLACDGQWILILPRAFNNFDDTKLAIVVAHEFGHIIDHQTGRNGHPLFHNIRYFDDELFAHAIAAYLYSKLVVKMVYEEINVGIEGIDFMNLDLKV